MAAHDVLYKYVEELTGEPVDTATFRPTFTGAMAALDTALRDSFVARENTISDALKEHMQSPHGNGGSSNTARLTMQVFPTEPNYIISLENMHVVIECTNEVRELLGTELTPMPGSTDTWYIEDVPAGSLVTIHDDRQGYMYGITRCFFYVFTNGPEYPPSRKDFFDSSNYAPGKKLMGAIVPDDPNLYSVEVLLDYWINLA